MIAMAELAEEALAPPEADATDSPQAQEPAGSSEQDGSDGDYSQGACDRRQGRPPGCHRPLADRFRLAAAGSRQPRRPAGPAALSPSTVTGAPTPVGIADSSAEEESAEEEEEEEASSGDEDEKRPLSQRSAYAAKHPLPQPTAPKRTRTNRFPKIPK